MLTSTKLAIRASELRSKINALAPGEETQKERRTLMADLEAVEVEYRDALKSEGESQLLANPGAPGLEGLTPEERERRELESNAELRLALRSIMSGEPLTGREAELQQHAGLSGNSIPWELIAPRERAQPATEDRVDSVSAAPAASHVMQHPILGRVFARAGVSHLGVAMPMVPVGEQNYPVISAGQSAKILAKDATHGDAGAATISAHKIAPRRIQSEYLFRREDQAVLMGLEEALRADLSDAMSDKLDAEVLNGGADPNLGGFLSAPGEGGLAAVDAPAAVPTFASAASTLAGSVDGKYAGSEAELSVLIGDETYGVLAGVFQENDPVAATTYYAQKTGGKFMASANIPDAANDIQDGIIAKTGAQGMSAVSPVWGGLTLIRDEVSKDLRKKGWISITAVMLVGFDILRADGFQRVRYKLA